MKIFQFRYFLLLFLLFSGITYVVYSAILFDSDDSNIWYWPYNTGYTDNLATVNKDNNLDGGPIICPNTDCGDGIVNGSDICDPADSSRTNWGVNWCNNSCVPINSAVCGDGIMTSPETCDDGVQNGHPGKCTVTCDGILPKCWNNIEEAWEECDKWSWGWDIDASTFCSQSCKIKPKGTLGGIPTCWDDEIDASEGEVCDDGSTNSDTIAWSCKTDCSGRVPIPCTGCACDNSCTPVIPSIPDPVVDPPAQPTNGSTTDSF